MSPDFSQQYDCSMSTSLSPRVRGNYPGNLFPCHFSFVYSTMLSFIFLVSFCTSVLRHLAVCNTAESMLCWCILTNCISGSSLLSTYSTHGLLLTASCHFLPVFWENTSDLNLLSSDTVHKWLVVSLLSGPIFEVFLGGS